MKQLLLLLFASVLFCDSYSQCFLSKQTVSGVISDGSTGSKEVDQLIYGEGNKMDVFFGVSCEKYFLVESRGANAMFAPHTCSKHVHCTGSVYLGTQLVLSLYQEKLYARSNVIAVLAHEYAHAMQSKYGLNSNGKYRELHADYLSGFYMASTGVYTLEEVQSFVGSFYERGDFDYMGADHHGTPTERGCAFIKGFELGLDRTNSVYDGYNKGLKYVYNNNPCSDETSNKSSPFNSGDMGDAGYEAYAIVAVAVVVSAVVLLNNDVYYHPSFSIPFDNNKNGQDLKPGIGWDFGLRRTWPKAALEFGFTSIKHKYSVDPLTNYSPVRKKEYFNINFLHDINTSKYTGRLMPYAGGGINLIDGVGISGIAGVNYRLFDRLKLDTRLEISNRFAMLKFGLIFKYQKTYLWHK
jgi:hypothetical protein